MAVTGAEGWAVSAVTEGAKSFTLTKSITVTADPEKPDPDESGLIIAPTESVENS